MVFNESHYANAMENGGSQQFGTLYFPEMASPFKTD